jgi:hypothetical protein
LCKNVAFVDQSFVSIIEHNYDSELDSEDSTFDGKYFLKRKEEKSSSISSTESSDNGSVKSK